MSEERAIYSTSAGEAQVTNYDATAELLATWRAQLPPIVSVLAYMEAVKLCDDLTTALERFETSAAFKLITGAQ